MPRSRILWFRGPQAASRAAATIGAAMVVTVLVSAAGSGWYARRQAIEATQTAAEDTAFMLAAHAGQVIAAGEFVLDGVAQTVAEARPADSAALRRAFGQRGTYDQLRWRERSFGAIDVVALFDADGELLNFSRNYPPPNLNVRDREGFQRAQQDPQHTSHLAAPVRNRVTGSWTFYLARRLESPDGRFIGVAMVGLLCSYFTDYYDLMRREARDHTAITLMRDDRAVLARSPADVHLLGQPTPALSQGDAAWPSFNATFALDGYPARVSVTVGDSLYLAGWRRQASVLGAIAGIGSLLLLAVFFVLVRVLRRRELQMSENEQLREAAEAANQAKSEFLATMSHEIRTPMNGILGAAELLVQGELSPRDRQLAGTLLDSGRSLLGIINDILDLSKIEAGEMRMSPAPFRPDRLLDEVHATFRHYAESKGLRLSTELADDVPPAVSGDAGRVRQVLVNLVSNAIKFTDRGAVVLRLSRYPVDATDRAGLRFEVEDSGIGIASEARELLFRPFAQADSSVARRFGGTGLGLAISHRLVSLMQGRIGFTSVPGEGACFWFELPLPLTDLAPEPTRGGTPAALRFMNSGPGGLDGPPSAEAAARAAPGEARLLLVEDNPVNSLVVEAQLESLGYRCDVAADGIEALARLRSGHYDAVLMDCMLPGLSGFDVTRAWREDEAARADGRRLPIIALTANVLDSNVEQCREAGMDDHLTKPCTIDRLDSALKRWLASDAPATSG